MVAFCDHADGFGSYAVAGVFGGEEAVAGPGRAGCACVVGCDREHGGAGLADVETDKGLDTIICVCAGIDGVFEEVSDQDAEFCLRDQEWFSHLDLELGGDPGFFGFFCIEGEDRVDCVVFAVAADILDREHGFVVF